MALFKTNAFYTPKLLKQHSSKDFIFGDNLQRVGKGGQAVIRDLPNAIGVATKVSPDNSRDAFFRESLLERHIVPVMHDLAAVAMVAKHRDVVVPVTEDGQISLGLGLARLDVTSPTTYKLIASYLNAIAEEKGGWREL